MTQRQLAESVGVDQGTVSRWEREVERPRPAKQAEIQKLLSAEEGSRALLRARAFVDNDILPSVLLDEDLRLISMSASGRDYYLSSGRNPDTLLGKSLEWDARRNRNAFFLDKVRECGLLCGDCILLRFVGVSEGRAHATVYEPIFDDGELVGMLCYITFHFELPKTEGLSIELIEVVPTAKPDKTEVIYRGVHADEAIRALSGGGRGSRLPRP